MPLHAVRVAQTEGELNGGPRPLAGASKVIHADPDQCEKRQRPGQPWPLTEATPWRIGRPKPGDCLAFQTDDRASREEAQKGNDRDAEAREVEEEKDRSHVTEQDEVNEKELSPA